MLFFRSFWLSLAVTVVSLAVAFVYGGWQALVLCAILGVLEISLSFDNAVVNATILERMSEFWVRMFLTVGILIAVFGMRLLFPLLLVGATAGLSPVEAFRLALEQGGPEDPDSYQSILNEAHPLIAAFGGMFLLMLFLDFVFEDRDIKWLAWVERPLARIGQLDVLSVIVAGTALVLAAEFLATDEDLGIVMVAGVLGLVTYLLVNGLGSLFEAAGGEGDEDEPHVRIPVAQGQPGAGGPSGLVKATGRAGFFLFLYLEVLDASFSFDGAIGAFAITSDPILIALGLGFIGAMFVRSLTVFLVRQGTLREFVYLEHGAHWAIGALAAILLLTVGPGIEVPEVVTGLIGVAFIGASFLASVARNRRMSGDDADGASVVGTDAAVGA